MPVKWFFFLIGLSPWAEEKIWKWWYERLAGTYRGRDWRYMNYGYAPLQQELMLQLEPEDEVDRVFIQLYQRVLEGVELKKKQVLEVGSGRGGGCDFIARYSDAASVTGIDLAQKNIELSQQFYHNNKLHFTAGNAEKIPFPDSSFDVVLNVESSHCYGDMEAFAQEVMRVLKPGGYFAWADLRAKEGMPQVEKTFTDASLSLLKKEDITLNVLKALDQISPFKEQAIGEKVPFLWRHFFSEFAGVQNSKIYKGFQRGDFVYYAYLFRK